MYSFCCSFCSSFAKQVRNKRIFHPSFDTLSFQFKLFSSESRRTRGEEKPPLIVLFCFLKSSLSLSKHFCDHNMSSKQFEPHTLSSGPISLTLLPYGLTFHSLIVKLPSNNNDDDIDERDLLIGYADPADHHFEASGGRGEFLYSILAV